MAQANANEYWSENVKEHFHTPPGTFTQDAEEITNSRRQKLVWALRICP